MANLTNAGVFYESGQVQQAFAQMTDAGAHTVYTLATKPWSNVPGYEYVIAPYGLLTGGAVTTAAVVANNTVDVAALTAMMPTATGASATTGVLSVGASTSLTVARGGSAYVISSITVTSAGAIAVVAGTAGAGPFVETRGAANGPPFIPVGSIEIAQVRYTSLTAAAVLPTEIFAVVGTHCEMSNQPVWSEDPMNGKITFAAALPVIHTGSVAKAVYARVATPIFAEIPHAKDWVPAETTNSVSSDLYYDGAIGKVSSSLGQAAFSVAMGDGLTDGLLAKKGQKLIFKFMPDKNKTPYQLTQGLFGVARTFAVGANPVAACTVSAALTSTDFAS